MLLLTVLMAAALHAKDGLGQRIKTTFRPSEECLEISQRLRWISEKDAGVLSPNNNKGMRSVHAPASNECVCVLYRCTALYMKSIYVTDMTGFILTWTSICGTAPVSRLGEDSRNNRPERGRLFFHFLKRTTYTYLSRRLFFFPAKRYAFPFRTAGL